MKNYTVVNHEYLNIVFVFVKINFVSDLMQNACWDVVNPIHWIVLNPPVSERTCVRPPTPPLYPPTLSGGSALFSPPPSRTSSGSSGEKSNQAREAKTGRTHSKRVCAQLSRAPAAAVARWPRAWRSPPPSRRPGSPGVGAVS